MAVGAAGTTQRRCAALHRQSLATMANSTPTTKVEFANLRPTRRHFVGMVRADASASNTVRCCLCADTSTVIVGDVDGSAKSEFAERAKSSEHTQKHFGRDGDGPRKTREPRKARIESVPLTESEVEAEELGDEQPTQTKH